MPAHSKLTLRPSPRNRRRSAPLRERMPDVRALPKLTVVACGRTLRRAAPLVLLAGIGAGLVTGARAGYRFVTTSPRFAIDTIEVRGTETLTPDQVHERIGVREGDNIFRADLGAVARALEAEPWIADVDVSRRLPRTIEISIRERAAAAVVDLGGLYLADAQGHVFKKVALDAGEGLALPVVTVIDRDAYAADPTQGAERIRHALATLARWNDGADRPAIGEVRVDTRHGVTLYTFDDAVAVRLGEAEDAALTARLHRFDAAWAALTPDERARARAIHLDHDRRPDLVAVAFAH